jgi:hypothetical protein
MADIQVKAKVSVETGDSSGKIKGIQDGLKGASSTAKTGGADFAKLKDALGSLGPAGDIASKGMGGLNQAFNILKANPIIGVFALIAGLVFALFQKFKQMEGVSDALGKAFGTLSGVFNKFINAILTPLIEGFVKLTELVTGGLISVLSALGITSEKTAERFGEITEALDDLEDAEKNSAIAMAESNRKLQEAREVAADANLPIKQRVAALKEAARIEKEELDKVVELNRRKAQLTMESIAMELGARQGLIDAIRSGSLEQLKAARTELMSMANVDKEKLRSIDQMIIAAEDAGAQSSKIAKKTQSQITGLEKEEHQKRVEAAKEAAERREKIRQEEQKKIDDHNKALNETLKLQLQAADNRTKAIEDTKEAELKKAQEDEAYLQQQMADEEKLQGVKIEALNKVAQVEKKNAEIKKEEDAQQKALAMSTLDTIGGMVDKNSVAGKAVAIAQAIMNTYEGASKAIGQGGIFGPIAAAATIAAGLLNVKKIIATKIPSMKGGGEASGGASTPSLPTASAPVVPMNTGIQLNAQSIQGIGNAAAGGVNRAYVLDSDIINSGERQQRLQRAARLG